MNARNFGLAAGLGGVGAGALGMMGGHDNPSDSGMKYLDQAQNQVGQYYQPYMQAGQQALGGVQNQYNDLMNNPGGKLNNIGQQFHQSPGFQFALQQALQGAGHAAAAGGMAGSPQHEQQNMQLATNLGNQDYYNWLGQAGGLFNTGVQGLQGIAGMGQNASNNMADQMQSILANKAQMGYAGTANQNQAQGNDFGNILGGLGTLAAFF
jgi:hypothetical protein